MIYRYWCAQCGHEKVTSTGKRPSHCGGTMKAQGRRDRRRALPHPTQPVADDGCDVLRFKPNAIVQHLLDHGGIDMNALAALDFSREDRVQFAQLIGYSVSGFGGLSYVSRRDYEKATDGERDALADALEIPHT